MTDDPTAHLNAEQRAAARAGDGPQIVLAGPGTGKTSTLVGRFAHLVDRGVPPQRIFCATFTRKAAEELTARLGGRLTGHSGRLWIGTFHGLCQRIVVDDPVRFGLKPRLKICDRRGQHALLARLNIWWDADDGGDLVDLISDAKDRLLDPAGYLEQAREDLRREEIAADHWRFSAATHYRTYQNALHAENAVDFGDMIRLLVEQMRHDPAYARHLSGRFDHVLVDEFQDVNPAQVALIDQLLATHRNLWAVGDDDQTLYGFRSSKVEYLLDFERRYPGARKHILSRNYRSTARIVGAATCLIRHNAARYEKELASAVAIAGPKIVCHELTDEVAEARWIADAIRALRTSTWPAREIAVLYRNNFVSADLQLALADRDLPIRLTKGGGFWESGAPRALLAILRLMADPAHPDRRDGLGSGRRARRYAELADRLRAEGASYATAARRATREVAGANLANRKAEDQDSWRRTVEIAGRRARRAGTLQDLEHEVTRAARAQDGSADAVTLTTVHSAKGLEWDAVFVAGFGRGLMPYAVNGHVATPAEERRVAYVAMTRARRLLTLVWAAQRGQSREGPSPYVTEAFVEADAETVDWRPTDRPAPWALPPTQPAPAAAAPPQDGRADPRPGAQDRVRHRRRDGTRWSEDEIERARLMYARDGDIDAVCDSLERGRDTVLQTLAAQWRIDIPMSGCRDGQLVLILSERPDAPVLLRRRIEALKTAAAGRGLDDSLLARPMTAEAFAGLSPAAWAARRADPETLVAALAVVSGDA